MGEAAGGCEEEGWLIDKVDARFREATYYAIREALNQELDRRHDTLIRWGIEYFESDEFPPDLDLNRAELMALAQAARRRENPSGR